MNIISYILQIYQSLLNVHWSNLEVILRYHFFLTLLQNMPSKIKNILNKFSTTSHNIFGLLAKDFACNCGTYSSVQYSRQLKIGSEDMWGYDSQTKFYAALHRVLAHLQQGQKKKKNLYPFRRILAKSAIGINLADMIGIHR